MQIFGFIAVIGLVALMSISGFQIVPESATNRADASQADGGSAPLLGSPMTDFRTPTFRTTPNTSEPNPVPTTPTFVPASISVKATQNIESGAALLRGEVVVGTETIGEVFFIYGYDKLDVDRSIAAYTTYEQVLTNKRAEASVIRVARSLNRDNSFATQARSLAPDTTYYVRLCAERGEQLSCSTTTSFTTTPGAYSPGDVRIPTIRINDESAAAADEMVLELTVTMRDAVDGDVYLVYGESQAMVVDASGRSYSAIDEDDELLQKTRIARNIRGTQRFFKTVDDLEGDTLLYYIVCVEYDGLRDGTTCTRTQSYRTYNEDFGTSPRVQTDAVVADGLTASLSGSVSMRDFIDGKVFFIYGSDLERITEAEGVTTMERLRQTKDRFQRVFMDADLDGNETYTQTVRDLLPGTLYAARMCVEFENQNDNYRDTAFVECGELRSFVTQ